MCLINYCSYYMHSIIALPEQNYLSVICEAYKILNIS